jgi:hypothetical protein
MATVTDDLVEALDAVGGLTGTVADKQRQYLDSFTGTQSGTQTDIMIGLSMEPTVLLPVPLPPVV